MKREWLLKNDNVSQDAFVLCPTTATIILSIVEWNIQQLKLNNKKCPCDAHKTINYSMHLYVG